MADFVNNVPWYTVWDAKSGDLLASANSFASAVSHWLKDGRQHVKYICQRELIPRSEVDSLTPPRRKEPHETH